MTEPTLEPVSQEFYDTQRKVYEAETRSIDIKSMTGCSHFFERKTASTVECRDCKSGWIDNGRFILENGKITSIK